MSSSPVFLADAEEVKRVMTAAMVVIEYFMMMLISRRLIIVCMIAENYVPLVVISDREDNQIISSTYIHGGFG